DGSGYPEGLARDDIPVGARIIMIADTIDAMTTDRPYRTALTLSKTIEELERYSGTQFDPALVRLVSQSPGIRRLLAPERGVSSPAPAMPLAMSTRPAWAQRSVRGGEHAVGMDATCIRDCSLTPPRRLLSSSDEIERRWKVLRHERNTCALTEIRDFGPPSPRVFHPLSRLVEILESLLFVPEHQQSLGKIHQAPDPRRPVRGRRSPFDTLFADADCL